MMETRSFFLVYLVAVCAVTLNIQAQVTVGSGTPPVAGALLEIKNRDATSPVSVTDATNITSETGGLGLPRVQLTNRTTLEPFIPNNADWENNTGKIKEQYAGLTVYNIKVSSQQETDIDKLFQAGIYIWDGSRWQQQGDGSQSEHERFFYLQPFYLPLNTAQSSQNFNLYEEYKRQFSGTGTGSVFISNNLALAQILSDENKRLYNPGELDYVVTFYDDAIITVNSIDPNGIMTYSARRPQPAANPKILINVVLVIKEPV